MRLWHKDLISVLPREQLVAQWRELSAIAGNIISKGTPNHILVNKINEYNYNHFITYAKLVRQEMTKRGYKTMDAVWDKICSIQPNYELVEYNKLYNRWFDNEYLMICYFNLKEKYLCGGISYDAFLKIESKKPFYY